MKPEELLKKIKDDYNYIACDFSKTRQNLLWPEIDYFMSHIKDGQTILDLGCGNGRLLNYLKNKEINYTGLDNSQELINNAKQLYPKFCEKFFVADMFALPFEDESFDVIFCLASFHHLPSKTLRLQALSEMKRVLKKDGKVLMTNWYVWQKLFWQNFFTNFTLKNKWNDFFIPWKSTLKVINRYYHGFTGAELIDLFKMSGFKIIEHVKFKKRNWLSVLKK